MSRDPEALQPVVRRRLNHLLEAARERGLEVLVTSTARTGAEQAALYAQGRKPLDAVNALRAEAGMPSIAPGENRIVTRARTSVHEFGCAFDLALVKDGRAVWDPEADTNQNALADYRELGRLGEALGLTWGGRFGLRDYGHFQYTGGLTLAELLAGKTNQAGAEGARENKEDPMSNAKKGVKSSEFYLALLGAVLPVLNSHLGLNIPVSGIMSVAGVIVSYIFSRTVVKSRT
ncbi:MAG: M15 family metallopeptidase [Nitrospirota bacterium]